MTPTWVYWLHLKDIQGMHAPWKSSKVHEFENQNSRFWKFMKSSQVSLIDIWRKRSKLLRAGRKKNCPHSLNWKSQKRLLLRQILRISRKPSYHLVSDFLADRVLVFCKISIVIFHSLKNLYLCLIFIPSLLFLYYRIGNYFFWTHAV